MTRTLAASLAAVFFASALSAQEAEIRAADLPSNIEWQLIDYFEDPDTRRLDPPVVVEAGETLRGDVGVVGGPVTIAGTLEGRLVVVGGNVEILAGGRVDGDLTVVDGEAVVPTDDAVTGTLIVYGPLGAPDRGRDGWEDEDDDRRDRGRRRARLTVYDDGRGFARLSVRTGNSYNRVEGLPLMFGPVIQTGGANPLRIEAHAIWRTESGTLDTDEMGYSASIEQALFGRNLRIGAAAHSVVAPIEDAGLTDLEASLAAAVLHDDYRDYFEREGWSAFARVTPERLPVELRVEYRDDEHATAFAGDPWSLFHGDDAWRLQPVAAEGDYRALAGELRVDTREDSDHPSHGTFARLWVERGLDGSLVRPALFDDVAGVRTQLAPALDFGSDITRGAIDLRQYFPVGGGSALGLRLFAAGSLTDDALPPQFQRALGGPGTLPGFDHLTADCNARWSRVQPGTATSELYPGYGCDRVAMAQLEVAGGLDFDFGFGDPDWDDDWNDWDMDSSPSWVFFVDAAKGWANAATGGDPRTDTELLVDAGVGFLIDAVGIYAALPVRGTDDGGVNFFIRFTRRF